MKLQTESPLRVSAEFYCTLSVANWYGPSQFLTTELTQWAKARRIGFASQDTMAAGPGLSTLTSPGTLRFETLATGQHALLSVAPLAALEQKLAATFPGAWQQYKRPSLIDVISPRQKHAGTEPALWAWALMTDDAEALKANWSTMSTQERTTACTVAAAAGANAVLALVLNAEPGLANCVDEMPAGNTSLHYAALAGNLMGVEILLAAGARVCAQNPVHTEPSHDAARAANAAILKILSNECSLQRVNRYGDTILHRLALYGGNKTAKELEACYEVVRGKLLLKSGTHALINFLAIPNADGFTVLDVAVTFYEDSLAKRLIGDGAKHGARWLARGERGFASLDMIHIPHNYATTCVTYDINEGRSTSPQVTRPTNLPTLNTRSAPY